MSAERRERRVGKTTPAAPEPAAGALPWPARLLAALAVMLVYLRTMAPSLHFGDGPELAAASHVLGIPHPTGYPLYMLLLHAWSAVLPVGEVITRTTLFSGACMAAAAGACATIAYDLVRRLAPKWAGKAATIAAVAFGVSSGLLRFHWQNAVVTEVYALQFLLAVLALRFLQLFFATGRTRSLALAALCMGLGLAHHRLAVMLLPALLVAVVHAVRIMPRPLLLRAVAAAAVLLVLPLAFYLYLPLRASARPALNWGNPTTLATFSDHVSGTLYTTYRFLQSEPGVPFNMSTYAAFASAVTGQAILDITGQAVPVRGKYRPVPEAGRAMARPTGADWLVVAAFMSLSCFGALVLLRQTLLFAITALLPAGLNMAIVYLYNIPDIDDYYLVPFWFSWLFTLVGVVTLLYHLQHDCFARRPALAYGFLLLPLLPFATHFSSTDRSADKSAETYAALLLPESRELLPEDSVLVTHGDNDIFISWYVQMVRLERTDVLTFGANFLHAPWYEAFFTEEQKSRYGLTFSSGMPVGVEQFAALLDRAVLSHSVGVRPVFTSSTDTDLLRTLNRKYAIIPWSRAVVRFSRQDPETTAMLLRVDPRTTDTLAAGTSPPVAAP